MTILEEAKGDDWGGKDREDAWAWERNEKAELENGMANKVGSSGFAARHFLATSPTKPLCSKFEMVNCQITYVQAAPSFAD